MDNFSLFASHKEKAWMEQTCGDWKVKKDSRLAFQISIKYYPTYHHFKLPSINNLIIHVMSKKIPIVSVGTITVDAHFL
jgi:hypothetical protein